MIASDDVSLDWIEWEAELERNGQAVDDPVLTTIHRFDCNGGKVCTSFRNGTRALRQVRLSGAADLATSSRERLGLPV